MIRIEERERKIIRTKGIRKTLSLIASMTKTWLTSKHRRGFAAEDKAYLAARYWQRKKIIKNARQTEGLSPEDIGMKDLILTFWNDKEIPIQVKDHSPNLWIMQKCRERGILILTIWPFEGLEVAKKKMMDLIISVYIRELEPFQIRKIIFRIQEMGQPLLTPKTNLKEKFISWLRKVRKAF